MTTNSEQCPPTVADEIAGAGPAPSAELKWHAMPTDPLGKFFSAHRASRDADDHLLRVLDGRVELVAVEHQKNFQRCVPNSLVSIDERMVPDEREAERGGLLDERRIQIDVVERRTGLCERGLQSAKVADS